VLLFKGRDLDGRSYVVRKQVQLCHNNPPNLRVLSEN
jgi:hypothetical protein